MKITMIIIEIFKFMWNWRKLGPLNLGDSRPGPHVPNSKSLQILQEWVILRGKRKEFPKDQPSWASYLLLFLYLYLKGLKIGPFKHIQTTYKRMGIGCTNNRYHKLINTFPNYNQTLPGNRIHRGCHNIFHYFNFDLYYEDLFATCAPRRTKSPYLLILPSTSDLLTFCQGTPK